MRPPKSPPISLLLSTEKMLAEYRQNKQQRKEQEAMLSEQSPPEPIIPELSPEDQVSFTVNTNEVVYDWQYGTHPRHPLEFDAVLSSAATLMSEPLPEYDWITEQSLRRGCLGVIAGPPGCGKSTLIIQMLVDIAAGLPALGIWKVPKPRKTLYISAEDDKVTIRHRVGTALDQLSEQHKKTALENGHFWPAKGTVKLCDFEPKLGLICNDAQKRLEESIEAVNPSVVVLDTLARFSGIEENNNSLMTDFCAKLEEIAISQNCTIILVHHSNKAAGDGCNNQSKLDNALSQISIRGASALAGCIRWGLVLAPLGSSFAAKKLGESARSQPEGSFIAFRVAKKNVGAPERVHYFGRGPQGVLYETEEVQSIGKDAQLTENAHKLAEEVRRREHAGEEPLSVSNAGGKTFSWSNRKTGEVVDKALELGILFKRLRTKGSGAYLCSPDVSVSS